MPALWGLLVQRGHRAGRAAYHEACRPAARRQLQRDLDRERWERMDPTRRDARIAVAHEATAAQQAATRDRAGNAGARWTAEDDAALVARWSEPAHVTAAALGRSLFAIWARKVWHRRRGSAL
jgi:hypothetical protein